MHKYFLDDENYYYEQKNIWKKSQTKISNKELLEIFCPEKKMLRFKIKEWQENCDEMKSEVKRVLKVFKEKSEKDLWFAEIYINKLIYPNLLKAQRHIYRLKSLMTVSRNKKSRINNFNEQLEIARNYPIEILAQSKLDLKSAGKNFISLCPFHQEKTPSFFIYPEHNNYHCYGCGAHGDQINLLMALEGIPFVEAVKMLQNK